MMYDTLIRNALIIDGSNAPGYRADVAILDGRIERIGDLHDATATEEIDAAGRVLAPGFIDVHTHDDTVVIRQPQMLPKLSQGVTTVIVGNCGISASPVSLKGDPPDPMNLLGTSAAFVYPTFSDYRAAVEAANTTLNVAALVGHTALRSNHLDDLFRTATPDEISAMREQLRESLEAGALGLSTGLAYASAFSASTDEVMQLTEELAAFGAVYYGMDENDVRSILAHPLSMNGSDGLPEDPFPHPRLWGAFPRVLGHFSRDVGLFPLHTAVHKMTGLSAARFGLKDRGEIREGHWADLVLFDPVTIRDVADFNDPQRAAEGIDGVWVNGVLSYSDGQANGKREGRFLAREGDLRAGFH
ncbi:D-aminoacylase [Pseudomonas sp. LB3P81]